MNESSCGHLLCNYLAAVSIDKHFKGEPSNDRYTEGGHHECYIVERNAYGGPRPFRGEEDTAACARYIDRLDPELVRQELERLRMRRSAMALAKHLRAEADARTNLLDHQNRIVATSKMNGSTVEREMAQRPLDWLAALGVDVTTKK